MTITTNLKELLEKQNLSLHKFHKISGISYQQVWAIANQKTKAIDFRLLAKICDKLDCDVSDVLIFNN